MNKYKYYFLLLICIFSNAQEPYYINYTLNDGLPSDNIYSIFQEENGIIWFTSDVGIVKYNSKNFELFNTDNGISDNEVFQMNQDSRGRIWMNTLNGKPSFIFKNKIYNATNSSLLANINGLGLIIDFYEDSNQNIYLAFRNGDIYKIDKNNRISIFNSGFPSLSGVWFDSSLYSISSEIIYNISKKIKKNVKLNGVYRIYHFKNRNLVSTQNKLFEIIENELISIVEIESNQDIINVIDEGNKLWICTRNGLLLYENNSLSKPIFKNYTISDLLIDFEGNYWVTTLNKGVLFIPSFDIKLLLPKKKINCLSKRNDNELWIGGFENDYYIKRDKKIYTETLNPKWRKDKISTIRFFNNIPYIIGKIGVEIQNLNKTERYEINSNDILVDKEFAYLGTTFTSKIKINEFNSIVPKYAHEKTIMHKRTNILSSDNSKNIWLGTNFGLYKYSKKDSLVYFGEKFDDLSISIEDILFDDKGELFLIATASKGLIILKNDTIYKKITTKNGLNSNSINSIKKIKKNEYLIGSNNGLNTVKLIASNFKITNHNSALGIKNKRIKDIEVLKDTIYLATDYGVVQFHSSYLNTKVIKPKCIIKPLKKIISYKNNDVRISFSGISYLDKGDVTYYYQLENQEKEWSTTKETQINYKSLPANKYTFIVYCNNGFGLNSDLQYISFEILPPFWQKKWFVGFCILLSLLFLYLIVKFRLRKMNTKFIQEKKSIQVERDKAKLEKQMVELEQKALRMQMNPHFIFNALNTIKGYYSEGNDIKASNYISKFSKLLRMLLENEEQFNPLENEIEMLRLYIELTQIRYKDKFDYTIKIDKNLKLNEIVLPTFLLQPLVENAIIHGLAPKPNKGFLEIIFEKENDFLNCYVKDNGIGMEMSEKNKTHKEHQSKALSIIKERLKLFDSQSSFKTIPLDKSKKEGTQVKIQIPIKYNWL